MNKIKFTAMIGFLAFGGQVLGGDVVLNIPESTRAYVYGKRVQEIEINILDKFTYTVCGKLLTSDEGCNSTDEQLQRIGHGRSFQYYYKSSGLSLRDAFFKYENLVAESECELEKIYCNYLNGGVDKSECLSRLTALMCEPKYNNLYDTNRELIFGEHALGVWLPRGMAPIYLSIPEGERREAVGAVDCSRVIKKCRTVEDAINGLREVLSELNLNDRTKLLVISDDSPWLVVSGPGAESAISRIDRLVGKQGNLPDPIPDDVFIEIFGRD